MRVSKKLQAATASALDLLNSNHKLSGKLRVQLIDLIFRAELQKQEQKDRQKQRLHDTKLWAHEHELITLKADTSIAALVNAAREELRKESHAEHDVGDGMSRLVVSNYGRTHRTCWHVLVVSGLPVGELSV
jgi:hypothetical protein